MSKVQAPIITIGPDGISKWWNDDPEFYCHRKPVRMERVEQLELQARDCKQPNSINNYLELRKC